MPGSYRAYTDRYWGSGLNASHFSHTDDVEPSALRWVLTCCQGTSGSSRCRNVGSLLGSRGLGGGLLIGIEIYMMQRPFAPGSVSLRLYPHPALRSATDIVTTLTRQAGLADEHGFDGV